jgi:gliding motility-associated-like protein
MLRKIFICTTLLLFFLAPAFSGMAGTLYWVGNGGNWNDAHHWSHTSGGNGGAGIPTYTDDVFFDLNSFSNPYEQVTITGTALCHTLQTSRDIYSPVLVGNSASAIDVYGSFMLEGPLDYQFQGSLHFKSSQQGNVINTGGRKLTEVYFDGSGSWKMYNMLYANGITVSAGEVIANGFEMACSTLTATGNNTKTIDITHSILFIEQQFTQQNANSLQVISPNGKIYFQHYQIADLASVISATGNLHKALAVTSSTYDSINLTCNNSSKLDSLGGSLAPCNGKAWITGITATDGGPFTIQWPVGTTVSANGDTALDVCAGKLTYQIYDSADGSLSAPTTISIGEPARLGIVYVPREPRCKGYCDGWIKYYLIGETPGYTYSWYNSGPAGATPGGASHILYDSSLCNGSYKVHSQDSKGCHSTLSSINITYTATVKANITHNNPTCNSNCNGNATATPVAGSGHGAPYTYVWEAPKQTTQTATNLCAGTYTVVVYDDSLCTDTATVTITAPTPVTVPPPTFTNVTCHGFCNGSATANPTGGTPVPGYTYKWTPGNQTTQTATGLCAGTYKVVAADGNGCKDSNTVTITQPNALAIQSISASPNPLLCNGNCNATASVTVLAGSGTPGYTYAWNNGSTNFTNTNTSVSGLCAGKYIVTVTDANSCTIKDSVTITQPNPITITNVIINPKCHGGATGSICATAKNGSPPYTYLWNNGQTTACATGLTAGMYTLTVTDKNGCSDTSKVTLTDPSAVTIATTSNPPTCFSNCNGSATATASNGNGAPYKYTWSNGKTTTNIINLCAGTYTITAADDSGCTSSTTVTIIAPSPVGINISNQVNVTCNGLCNGKVSASASGGTSGYTYKWSNGQTTTTATNLCAGTYKVVATDANGCKDSTNVTITQPNPLKTVTSANPNPLHCNGDCNAVASVTSVTGGTAPYSYLWSNLAAGNSDPNLCAGKYIVTVTDAQSCTIKDSVTITQPTGLNVALNPPPVSPVCNGACTGSISTVTTGGAGGYSWLWKPTGQSTAKIINVCAGTYTLVATDKNGCVDSATVVTLTQPTAISAGLTITEVTCNGTCDGKAVANVSGGTPNYTYTWNGGVTQTTDSITGLCANANDSMRVNDANGCSASVFFSVTQPPILSTAIKSQNTSCTACNGDAKVSVKGGTPPYVYSWSTSPVQSTDSASNLCPGTYTVTVKDADSCVINQPVTIVPTVTITITSSATGLSCFGSCNGTASANASGGNPPYIYLWSNGQTTSTATGLCAGTYYITVHDNGGCTNSDSVVFSNPPQLMGSTSQTNISCNGACVGTAADTVTGGTPPYTYLWSNGQTTSTASGLCQGANTVKVVDFNGCSIINTVTITEAQPLAANPTVLQPTCTFSNGYIKVSPTGGVGKYTYLWNNGSTIDSIGSLPAGTYTVTITDSLGCNHAFAIALSNSSGATLVSYIKNMTCWTLCDGSDSVAVTAGTGPFTFSWSTGSTTSSISNLCAGPYICTITDGNGCLTSESDTIKKPKPISPGITVQNVSCNGANDGSISLGESGGNGGYSFTWAPNVSTTSTASNLVPGTYTITIKDSKGCDTTFTVKITQPNLLTVAMSSTNVTCHGSCNGTATGSVHGGTLPYVYSWTNGGVDSNIVNLCPNSYTLSVTDVNGCTASGNVTITQPAVLKDSMSHTNDSCYLESDGTATMTLTGGTSPYSYTWTGGSTTSSITGLSAALYIVTATDKNLCTIVDSVTITQPAQITISVTPVNSTCNGDCNGSITATPSAGTSPYTYAWSNGETTSTATGLCATNYTVVVTDANKCSATKDTSVGQPPKLNQLVTGSNTLCPSSCDGTAQSKPSGGKAPYTYSWSTGASTSSITNLCAATYTVVVTDANLCTDTGTITITNPSSVSPNASSSASNCGAVCNGVISLSPSGGTPPYKFLWNTGNTTDSITNKCAGLYTYTITDANSCVATFTTILTNSSGPTAVGLTTVNDSCNGKCDGRIILSPITGGTAPFIYSFGGPQQSSDTGKNLCAGKYTYIIIDSNLCQLTDTTTITQPTVITDTATITKATCAGLCNGTITLHVHGGTPPYQYLWSGGVPSTTNSAGGLCAGIYTITVTDADNCSLIEMDTVQPSILVLPNQVTVNPLCFDSCTGSASLSPSGGTSPYTYSWSNSATTSSISKLCAGTYTVTVTDQNSCIAQDTAKIIQPSALSAVFKVTPITCNGDCNGKIVAAISGGTPGYTYLWNTTPALTTDSVMNLCPGRDTIHVTDLNGCPFDSSIALVNPPALNYINTPTNASCNTTADGSVMVTVTGGTPPYVFSWSTGLTTSGVTTSTISNLLPGQYILSLTDSVNCDFTDTIKIVADTTVLAKVGNDTAVCSGSPAVLNGSASINAAQYEWFASPRTLVGTTAVLTITPVATTTYMLVVSDGTCRDSTTMAVTINPLPVINPGNAQTIFTSASATLGGSPTSAAGSTYLWQPSAGMKDSTVSNPVVSATVTSVYTVTVTSPFGCVATDTVSLFVIPQFIPPDGFTPNGDGINDVWTLSELANFPNATVEIFNRWGERIYHSDGYKIPWDGTYMHEQLPVGTYYYIINLHDPRFPQAYTGPVTIMR